MVNLFTFAFMNQFTHLINFGNSAGGHIKDTRCDYFYQWHCQTFSLCFTKTCKHNSNICLKIGSGFSLPINFTDLELLHLRQILTNIKPYINFQPFIFIVNKNILGHLQTLLVSLTFMTSTTTKKKKKRKSSCSNYIDV